MEYLWEIGLVVFGTLLSTSLGGFKKLQELEGSALSLQATGLNGYFLCLATRGQDTQVKS